MTTAERASEHPQTVELRDGTRMVIRPVRAADKDAIVAAFERMSPQSRYRRFFSPLQRLTERDLAYLTEVDHRDHEALISFAADTGTPIGAARFVRWAEPAEAEVAVVVVDDFQGRGAATALLERLVERAREEGIERFLALVMDGNPQMLEVLEHLAPGAPAPRRSASGHLEVVIELPPPGAGIAGRLDRLLGAAAGGLVVNPWRVLRRGIAALRSQG